MTSSWSFIEHATNHLLRPRMGDSKHPTLWPSEATAVITDDENKEQVVGKCRRATFFRYMSHWYKFDPKKYGFYSALADEIKVKSIPPDRYMLWIWRAGELYEDYLINIAKESGVYIGGQIPIYIPEWNISGKIDIVTINPDTGKLSNVEAKSVYGYGGNQVLGTPGMRNKGQMGAPRDSNLMQIAIYDWWNASADDSYEHSRLIYGGRDTGRYAEYAISTEKEGDTVHIDYAGIAPNKTAKTRSKITINSILEQYKLIDNSVQGGIIPDRDYELKFLPEKIDTMYEKGELGKTDSQKHAKYLKYKSGESKRKIKPLIKGNWQCNLCKFKDVCYKSTDIKHSDYGSPRTL